MLASRQPVSTAVKPRVLVVSLDFDGCLFNHIYLRSQSQNRLMESNAQLIEHILKEISAQHYERVIFMVGSNRQSKIIDDKNSHAAQSESCFTALQNLCAALQSKTSTPCEVDGFLLADVYGNRPAGENFQKAVRQEEYEFSDFIWDEFKYSIIYGQMHRVASQHPDADITFHFYDDREDIFFHLAKLYQAHKMLMPANLKLIFYIYNGQDLQLYDKDAQEKFVQGSGVIDVHYSKNILIWIRCGETPACKEMSEKISDNQAIARFKSERISPVLTSSSFPLFQRADLVGKCETVDEVSLFRRPPGLGE